MKAVIDSEQLTTILMGVCSSCTSEVCKHPCSMIYIERELNDLGEGHHSSDSSEIDF